MSLEDFLQSDRAAPRRRCKICNNKAAAADVEDYLRRRESGEIALTVHYVWEHYFRPEHGIQDARTIRTHIMKCLGREVPK